MKKIRSRKQFDSVDLLKISFIAFALGAMSMYGNSLSNIETRQVNELQPFNTLSFDEWTNVSESQMAESLWYKSTHFRSARIDRDFYSLSWSNWNSSDEVIDIYCYIPGKVCNLRLTSTSCIRNTPEELIANANCSISYEFRDSND